VALKAAFFDVGDTRRAWRALRTHFLVRRWWRC